MYFIQTNNSLLYKEIERAIIQQDKLLFLQILASLIQIDDLQQAYKDIQSLIAIFKQRNVLNCKASFEAELILEEGKKLLKTDNLALQCKGAILFRISYFVRSLSIRNIPNLPEEIEYSKEMLQSASFVFLIYAAELKMSEESDYYPSYLLQVTPIYKKICDQLAQENPASSAWFYRVFIANCSLSLYKVFAIFTKTQVQIFSDNILENNQQHVLNFLINHLQLIINTSANIKEKNYEDYLMLALARILLATAFNNPRHSEYMNLFFSAIADIQKAMVQPHSEEEGNLAISVYTQMIKSLEFYAQIKFKITLLDMLIQSTSALAKEGLLSEEFDNKWPYEIILEKATTLQQHDKFAEALDTIDSALPFLKKENQWFCTMDKMELLLKQKCYQEAHELSLKCHLEDKFWEQFFTCHFDNFPKDMYPTFFQLLATAQAVHEIPIGSELPGLDQDLIGFLFENHQYALARKLLSKGEQFCRKVTLFVGEKIPEDVVIEFFVKAIQIQPFTHIINLIDYKPSESGFEALRLLIKEHPRSLSISIDSSCQSQLQPYLDQINSSKANTEKAFNKFALVFFNKGSTLENSEWLDINTEEFEELHTIPKIALLESALTEFQSLTPNTAILNLIKLCNGKLLELYQEELKADPEFPSQIHLPKFIQSNENFIAFAKMACFSNPENHFKLSLFLSNIKTQWEDNQNSILQNLEETSNLLSWLSCLHLFIALQHDEEADFKEKDSIANTLTHFLEELSGIGINNSPLIFDANGFMRRNTEQFTQAEIDCLKKLKSVLFSIQALNQTPIKLNLLTDAILKIEGICQAFKKRTRKEYEAKLLNPGKNGLFGQEQQQEQEQQNEEEISEKPAKRSKF